MVAELAARSQILDIGPTTAYLGGGTPTTLSPPELEQVLGAVQGFIRSDRLEEFTIEANPATLDAERARLVHSYGANRISIGAQSFDRADLAVLERIHQPEDIAPAVKTARQAGLEQVNLDLIFGIPGQSLARWRGSLRRALDLQPNHLACYGLTYEPGTKLTSRRDRGLLTPCDQDLEADMFLAGVEMLTAAGYEHYEISNFAQPGGKCAHNLHYWRNLPYVGIGPSAVSYLNGERTRNVPDVDAYIRMIEGHGDATVERERLEGLAFAGECAMLALRMTCGIEVAEFRRRTSYDPMRLFQRQVGQFVELGLLETVPAPGAGGLVEAVRLTREGLLKADAIMAEFVNPAPPEAIP
jgi:oxygen-independent coproporphyrinogen-3 oxidase